MIYAWVKEIILWAFYLLVSKLGIFVTLPDTKVKSSKLPVVLIHGWFASGMTQFLLKQRLEKAGYRVYVPDLGWHIERLERTSKSLGNYLSGIGPCVVIGHSSGGIIALYCQQHFTKNIKKLICLGSPFFGTRARFLTAFSPAGRQMMSKTKFLKDLREGPIENVVSVYTEQDQLVDPKSCVLKGAKPVKVATAGHISLIYSRKTFRAILKEL